jgi:hypothetical protein
MSEVVEVRVQCRAQQSELVVGEVDRVSHGRNLTRGLEPGMTSRNPGGERLARPWAMR